MVIAHTIQLALAPVFVLVAIGNVMNILSTRLSRIVDRSRHLIERHGATDGGDHDAVVREMRMLDKRIAIIGRAIFLMLLSGLTIGVVIAMLFLDGFTALDLQRATAVAFTIAIALMMVAGWAGAKTTRCAGRDSARFTAT